MLDIPNCAINDHNCSQICVEVEGSFNCSCYPGYELQDDEATCTGTYVVEYICRIRTYVKLVCQICILMCCP